MALIACRRCGTCCRSGGPALHDADVHLLERIPMGDLVCLRRGEPANDPRKGGIRPLERELIKIRGKAGGWECVYFRAEPTACSIYEQRPLECRSLSCEDTDEIFLVMDTPTIERRDFMSEGSALWECIVEHERLFPVAEVVEMARDASISSELDRIIRHEMNFRQILAEKVGASDEDLWAYFGRPLWLVLLPLNRELKRYGSKDNFTSKC